MGFGVWGVWGVLGGGDWIVDSAGKGVERWFTDVSGIEGHAYLNRGGGEVRFKRDGAVVGMVISWKTLRGGGVGLYQSPFGVSTRVVSQGGSGFG